MPQWIRHTDPHADAECDHLNQHATQSTEYHDQWGCCKKPPFFAGPTVYVLNDARNLWLSATIICKANNGSYLVQVIGGGQYRCSFDHILECHLDAGKSDTSNNGDVATAAWTSAPAITQWDCQQLLDLQLQHQLHQQPDCKLHAKLCLQYIHHNEHRHYPMDPSDSDWHGLCCPMQITLKQEATIRALRRDIEPDCPSWMNLMMPWPGSPPAKLMKCCTLN